MLNDDIKGDNRFMLLTVMTATFHRCHRISVQSILRRRAVIATAASYFFAVHCEYLQLIEAISFPSTR